MHQPIQPPGAPIDRRRERYVRFREVSDRTGLSRTTIYRRIAEGTFPGPVAIGAHAVAWRESELDRWIDSPMEWRAAA